MASAVGLGLGWVSPARGPAAADAAVAQASSGVTRVLRHPRLPCLRAGQLHPLPPRRAAGRRVAGEPGGRAPGGGVGVGLRLWGQGASAGARLQGLGQPARTPVRPYARTPVCPTALTTAWPRSTPASRSKTGPVEVDEALLRRLHARAVAAARREAEEEVVVGGGGGGGRGLDADDAAAYRRRMADLMLPGETVLAALRRLGEGGGAGACRSRGEAAAGTVARCAACCAAPD
jgi:hypothetical protein